MRTIRPDRRSTTAEGAAVPRHTSAAAGTPASAGNAYDGIADGLAGGCCTPRPPLCAPCTYPSRGRGSRPRHSSEHAFTRSGSTSVPTQCEIHTRWSPRSSKGRSHTLQRRLALVLAAADAAPPPVEVVYAESRGNGGLNLRFRRSRRRDLASSSRFRRCDELPPAPSPTVCASSHARAAGGGRNQPKARPGRRRPSGSAKHCAAPGSIRASPFRVVRSMDTVLPACAAEQALRRIPSLPGVAR